MDKGYDEKFGARPLRRALQKYLEDPLAEEIISAQLQEGDRIEGDAMEGQEELAIRIIKGEGKVEDSEKDATPANDVSTDDEKADEPAPKTAEDSTEDDPN